MVRRMRDSGDDRLSDRLRGWPREAHLGDMFSGAGSFYKIMNAATAALRKIFPREMQDFEAGQQDLFTFFALCTMHCCSKL